MWKGRDMSRPYKQRRSLIQLCVCAVLCPRPSLALYFAKLTRVNSKSQDRSPTRTYSGSFSGEDSLGPGQSMEIGKADAASKELSVDYVRLGDGWRLWRSDAGSAESSGK